MEMFCPRCGFPAKIRRRASFEGVDDISPLNYDRLKGISKKLERGKYEIYDFKKPDIDKMAEAPLARYKDTFYRTAIAKKYGMFVMVNDQRFWTPYLIPGWKPGSATECQANRPLLDVIHTFWPEKEARA